MTAPADGARRLETREWTVDAAASRAQFRVRDVLHRPVVGTLPVVAGRVRTTDGTVTVSADLDLAGVDTGNARRDADLRGRRFLDADRAGQLRFDGGPGAEGPDGRWRLPGELALRSSTCPVAVEVDVEQAGGALRVRATTTVDRRDLGIRVPRVLVGSRVDVVVEAVLLPA